MRFQSYQLVLACVLSLLAAHVSHGQGANYEFRGIPATIEELDLAFNLKGKFTGQVDLQTVTQGAYPGVNNNPFAYWQRAHLRPWLQYHQSKNVTLAASLSYMKRYAIPSQGNKRGDEVRLTLMSTFTQPKSWGQFL